LDFICDACQRNRSDVGCCICGNEGLVKMTEEGEFGHPICLMMSKYSLIKSYKSLSFYCQRNKKKGRVGKCCICGKQSQLS
jgi:hypothetical protein